jgi:DNA processing protein
VAAGSVATCALSSVPGIGPVALGRIAAAFGTLDVAVSAGARQIAARSQEGDLELRPESLAFLAGGPDLLALGLRTVEAARAAGACIALPGDPLYPPLLRSVAAAPALLYVRGSLRAEAPRVAIVGSREASQEGLSLARELGEGLARAGVQVVSGGARGVDAAAHAGALWGEGTTVAVLGCGIDVVYPRENAALFGRIAGGGGAIVSEFPPGAPSVRGNFPRRNRTLSGLSSAVVVVRAASGSGALITATFAAAQGRPVFALPGDPHDPLCAGPNHLIETGAARAVSSASEVLRYLGWPIPERLAALELGRGPSGSASLNRAAAPGHRRPSDGGKESLPDALPLDEVAARLWNLLDERRPLHLDELAERGEIRAQDALRGLQELELKGLCAHRPGKFYLRRLP